MNRVDPMGTNWQINVRKRSPSGATLEWDISWNDRGDGATPCADGPTEVEMAMLMAMANYNTTNNHFALPAVKPIPDSDAAYNSQIAAKAIEGFEHKAWQSGKTIAVEVPLAFFSGGASAFAKGVRIFSAGRGVYSGAVTGYNVWQTGEISAADAFSVAMSILDARGIKAEFGSGKPLVFKRPSNDALKQYKKPSAPESLPSPSTGKSSVPRTLLDDIVDEANRVAVEGAGITESQRQVLRQNLPQIQRRNKLQNEALRAEFVSNQGRHITDWERMTGRTWPTGSTPHHIISLESGGANAWWNLMPTRGSLPNHSLPGIPGPHAAGGVLRSTIQQGRRALPPGRETDLRGVTGNREIDE